MLDASIVGAFTSDTAFMDPQTTNGGTIQGWIDETTGNANKFVGTGTAGNLTLQFASQNGLSGVQSVGTSGFSATSTTLPAAISTAVQAGGSGLTIAIAFTVAALPTAAEQLVTVSDVSSGLAVGFDGLGNIVAAYKDSPTPYSATVPAPAAGTLLLVVASWQPPAVVGGMGEIYLSVNGSAIASKSYKPDTHAFTSFVLSEVPTQTDFYELDVWLAPASTTGSASDFNNLTNYLYCKWAATTDLDHPLTASFAAVTLPTTDLGENCPGIVFACFGQGQYTYTLVQPAPAPIDVTYTIDSFGVLNAYVPGAVINDGNPRTDQVLVTVTDGKNSSVTITCNISYVEGPLLVPVQPLVFYTSQSPSGAVSFNYIQLLAPPMAGPVDVTITDPTGNFTGDGYVKLTGGAWPTAGIYPLQLVGTYNGGTITGTMFLNVIADSGPAKINYVQLPGTISSATPAGTIAATAFANGFPLLTTYALVLPANLTGTLSINGLTGVISIAGALPVGTNSFTVTVTRNVIQPSPLPVPPPPPAPTATMSCSLTVVAGNILPSSNLTMVVATNLTNYNYPAQNSTTVPTGQGTPVTTPLTPFIVGNPVVTGITGTPFWTLNQPYRCLADETQATNPDAHGYTRYVINSSTGQITAVGQLSAQTDMLTVTCTDGINTCTNTFNVVVSAFVGPTLYVGEGMSTLHGANGFEHLASCLLLFQSSNGPVGNPELGMPNPYAGATVYIYSNEDADYYANDNGGDSSQFDGDIHGPVAFVGVQGSGGAQPRLGGVVGSTVGGVGYTSKGFLVTYDADISFTNLEISYVHANPYQPNTYYPMSGNTGCAIRQNANTWGNLTITNCYIHDCDQGIETGDVPGVVTLIGNETVNCGGVYVSAGATHNIYIGGNGKLIINNHLSWRTINGHTLKSRAAAGVITNSYFYDGERGSASCQMDICDGGTYTVHNCVLHKGPMPQNPNSIQFCAEMAHPIGSASLTVSNCTFICDTPLGFGVNGLFLFGQCLVLNGVYSTITSTSNTYYAYNTPGLAIAEAAPVFNQLANANVTGVTAGTGSVITSTGMTLATTTQPALNLKNPNTGVPSPRPGPLYVCYDGENRNNWTNFFDYWIDPGSDDIRIPHNVPVGTNLGTLTVGPAPYIAQPAGTFVNPFADGATWDIVVGAANYYGTPYVVASPGQFLLNASTGVFSVGETLTAGQTYNVIISAVSSSGSTTIQEGFYIVAD